jgi:hypothetical protein
MLRPVPPNGALMSISAPSEMASSAFQTAKLVVGVVPPICGLSQEILKMSNV